MSTRKLAFHEMMARLGVGDLHPGGREASSFLLAQFEKSGARRVLEIGAGIGCTTERLMSAGFQVTPLEPNPVMREALGKRLRIEPLAAPFENFNSPDGLYDALIGESVFYALDVVRSFAKARRLLCPGGVFGFAEMFWTETASADVVAFIHDQTKRIFGIPMAPRDLVTSAKWDAALRDAGFSEVVTMTVAPGGADYEASLRRRQLLRGLIRHPSLIREYLTYRPYQQLEWVPPAWLETRVAVWRRD